ncbi:MAG TPA: DUF3574 domain-containing protein [Acetobacteraceae bacterium]|nr:DUF3574 domain-containing protein [Acetobacteraceae bacterium]
MRKHRVAAAVAACAALAGCADLAPSCRDPAGHSMLVATLFFGRSIAPAYQSTLGQTVTDADWAAFERAVLTRAFPDGLTELDATGQWRNPGTGVIGREPTKLVIIAAPDTDQTRQSLDQVIDRYRTEFHQQSVGLALQRQCTNF